MRIFSHILNKLVSKIIWCIVSDANRYKCQKRQDASRPEEIYNYNFECIVLFST